MILTKKHALLLIVCVCAALFSKAQITPDDLPGLVFWIRADSGLVTAADGKVSAWLNLAQPQSQPIQPVPVVQPTLFEDVINGLPAVSFDGVDDFMEFPEVNGIRTAFWVVRENPEADPDWPRRSLLGHHEVMYFLRGDGKRLWDPFASPAVINGQTKLNFQVVNGVQTSLPDGFNLISLVTSSEAKASNLTMDLNIYGRTWWGEIAEIILYDQSLSAGEILGVEEYLADKYTPSFEEIADIIVPYGFCDTIVCAPAGMSAYQWFDGSTSQCMTIGSSGLYSVIVTDDFGRTFSDSFLVEFPGLLPPSEATICAGDLFVWNTELDHEDYNFNWSTGESSSALSTDESGEYSLMITDTLGCSRQTSFTLSVDEFPIIQWLDASYTLCAGNVLTIADAGNDTQFIWNTNSTSSSIVITDSGAYSVVMTNSNGCVASITADVVVAGVAPEIELSYSPPCSGNPMSFQASSSSPIQSWEWNFGLGFTPGNSAVSHTWTDPGLYEVVVRGGSADGCVGEHSVWIEVAESPLPQVIFNAPCTSTPTPFSVADSETYISAEWSFGMESIQAVTTEYTFELPGIYSISVSVVDANGCSGQWSGEVVVLESPGVSINHAAGCFGDLVQFSPLIELPQGISIITGQWYFGDGNSSGALSPLHFYAQPGSYSATYSIIGSNGCAASAQAQVGVFLPPSVDFTTGNACVGSSFSLIPEIISQEGDPVFSYQWWVNGQLFSQLESTDVVFDSNGLVPVALRVTTLSGCQAEISQQIPVWPTPMARFKAAPVLNSNELSWHFLNQSEGINLFFEWSFGNGLISHEVNPSIQFDQSGPVLVQLRATSLQGCEDIESRNVEIAPPVLDLSIEQTSLQPAQGNLSKVVADVRNLGNVPVTRLEASWQGGGEQVITQSWEVDWWPGESLTLEFDDTMDPVQLALDYFCVQIGAPDIELNDQHPDDNVKCLAIRSGGLQLYPPFPNPGDSHFFLRCVTPAQGDVEIWLVDTAGEMVRQYSDSRVKPGFHQYLIDLRGLSDGTYLVVLIFGDQKRTARFSKLKR